MLDKTVIREFIDDYLEEIKTPKTISKKKLVETFCKFVEDDYYEWLKDNSNVFFNYRNPDWRWIKKMVIKYSK